MADKKPTSKKTAAEAAEQQAKGEAVKEQALEGPLGQAIAAVRTPVYAYVGVNDLAIQAVSGMVAVQTRSSLRSAVLGREALPLVLAAPHPPHLLRVAAVDRRRRRSGTDRVDHR